MAGGRIQAGGVVAGRPSGRVHLLTEAEGGDLPLQFHAADRVAASSPAGTVGGEGERRARAGVLAPRLNAGVMGRVQRVPGDLRGTERRDLRAREAPQQLPTVLGV